MVIANLLETRNSQVMLLTPAGNTLGGNKEEQIELIQSESRIEAILLTKIVKFHLQYMNKDLPFKANLH